MVLSQIRLVLYANFTVALGLCVLLGFVWLNTLFDGRQRRLFMRAITALLFVIVCISTDFLVTGIKEPWAVALRRFTSFVNFGASPLIPIALSAMFNKKKRRPVYYIPAIASALCSAVSMVYPLVFHINIENAYDRGPLFILPFAVMVFYMLVLVLTPSSKQRQARSRERSFLILVIFLMCCAMIMELTLKMSFMLWSGAGMSLILYYLLLNISFYTLDGLTGCYNRLAYTQVLINIAGKKQRLLTMMDLNGLKAVNDTQGHAEGDRLLLDFAELISRHTAGSSELYRIGGDEFVLLTDTEKLDSYREGMEKAQQEALTKNISFAFGEAKYEPWMDLEAVSALADERMYQMKKEMKAKKETLAQNE